ncbi:MAG: hypothetical protein IJW63_11195 [Lachnospiraceae bacterium]|nr:hypothetical protein [Lachnospiraceae bacterium]
MKKDAIEFIKNFFRALSANVTRILFTLILTLLLPKILGEQEYGMWQLYLFYVTYACYNSFGWSEGIYLKYGGQDYYKLDKKVIAGQVWGLGIYEVLLTFTVGFFAMTFAPDSMKSYVLMLAFLSAGLDNVRYMLQFLLQCTNRIKEYARIVMVERVLFFSLAILFVLIGSRDYAAFIYSEIVARILSLIYAVYICRDVIFVKMSSFKELTKEAKYLISCGFKLSFANLASQLIIGIVRFAVEWEWGTVVFGKISLTLSMSNMLITCLAAVSVVLFPVLRRMDSEKLKSMYPVMRMVLTVPLYALLLIYIPFRDILVLWLPQYEASLRYLAILFPIFIYEVRTTILNNTYLNTYRKEKYILYVNVVTVLISLCITVVTVGLFKSLDLAVASIVLLVMLKCLLTEIWLRKIVGGGVLKETLQELVLTVVFIVSGWYIGDYRGTAIYAVLYVGYLLLNKKEIVEKFSHLKSIIGAK